MWTHEEFWVDDGIFEMDVMVKAKSGRVAVIRPEDVICQLRFIEEADSAAITQFGVAYRSRETDYARGATAVGAASAPASAEDAHAFAYQLHGAQIGAAIEYFLTHLTYLVGQLTMWVKYLLQNTN